MSLINRSFFDLEMEDYFYFNDRVKIFDLGKEKERFDFFSKNQGNNFKLNFDNSVFNSYFNSLEEQFPIKRIDKKFFVSSSDQVFCFDMRKKTWFRASLIARERLANQLENK